MSKTHIIRIEHGDKKGIKISDGFRSEGSRITTSTNRCVLFNVLMNKFHINFNNLLCADLCCGSGVVGFELLSLGCKECLFVDCDRQKLKNIDNVILKHNFKASTIYSYLPNLNINKQFDIIFFDPPYENDFVEDVIKMIDTNNLLAKNGVFIVETTQEIKTLDNLKILYIKKLKNNAFFYFLSYENLDNLYIDF